MILAAAAALAHTGTPRYLDAHGAAYALVPGRQRRRPGVADADDAAAASTASSPASVNAQPGRRVDPDVADGARDDARDLRATGAWPIHVDGASAHRGTMPARAGRRPPRAEVTMDVDAADIFTRHPPTRS